MVGEGFFAAGDGAARGGAGGRRAVVDAVADGLGCGGLAIGVEAAGVAAEAGAIGLVAAAGWLGEGGDAATTGGDALAVAATGGWERPDITATAAATDTRDVNAIVIAVDTCRGVGVGDGTEVVAAPRATAPRPPVDTRPISEAAAEGRSVSSGDEARPARSGDEARFGGGAEWPRSSVPVEESRSSERGEESRPSTAPDGDRPPGDESRARGI